MTEATIGSYHCRLQRTSRRMPRLAILLICVSCVPARSAADRSPARRSLALVERPELLLILPTPLFRPPSVQMVGVGACGVPAFWKRLARRLRPADAPHCPLPVNSIGGNITGPTATAPLSFTISRAFSSQRLPRRWQGTGTLLSWGVRTTRTRAIASSGSVRTSFSNLLV